jgi:hypothetical protein
MKKLCIFLMALAPAVNGGIWPDWRNAQPLEVSQPGWVRLNLPPATLDAARPGLEDLRIVDATGHEVPYRIEYPPAPEPLNLAINERIENHTQTRLFFNLGAGNLKLSSLWLETDDVRYARSASVVVRQLNDNTVNEQVLASGMLCRTEVEGQPPRLEMPLDVTVPGRELLVFIENRDRPPLVVKSVVLQRKPVCVVFRAAQAGTFQVLTGNLHADAPRYAAVGQQETSVVAVAMSPNVLASNLPSDTQEFGTPLDTADWARRKHVQVSGSGMQQVDLDLDVVTTADGLLRDLRVVRDGKQCPYLIEQTSLLRGLTPEVSVENNPRYPTVSRWLLKLKPANIPLKLLTCTARSPLFRRQMVLFEEPVDDRGKPEQRHHLGEAEWVRTGAAAGVALELKVTARPQTDTLVLETDNGDNPAIVLENFQFYHAVTRLWFHAPKQPDTFLYYGNRGANAPRYDLNLVAAQLLTTERAAATLGTTESLKQIVAAGKSRKNQLLWSALGVVVLVVLALTARLLLRKSAAKQD